MVELRGLVGVIMGRGAPDRDMRPGLRGCGDVYMLDRDDEAAVAVAEAAMSVSESSMCGPEASRSSRTGVK
jgi:hypothetical protein